MGYQLFDKAVTFATKAHSGQFRKNQNIPYILHPMEVANIIATMTDDEDVIIAGLLHDTVEDTPVTIEEIEKEFGHRVRELVESETENKRDDQSKKQTWKIRKQESIDELNATHDIGVKILWLADKVSNMRSFYRLYDKVGNDLWLNFNQSDPVEQKWYYKSIEEALKDLENTMAYKEYKYIVSRIFENV